MTTRTRRIPTLVYPLVLAALVIAYFVIAPSFGRNDQELTRAMVGSWIAKDPTDNALHRREQRVSRESMVFRSDGTLTHSVTLASTPDAPEDDIWGWKIIDGRLLMRFLGEEGTGQWLPGFAFSVSDDAMSISVLGRPAKRFKRN